MTTGPVLIFGEDANDRTALRLLILALRPNLADRGLRPLRQPITLVKNLAAAKLRARADKLAPLVRGMQAKEGVSGVVISEDADDFEPAHLPLAARIQQTYAHLPVPVYAVVPAWELETWWFLFPDAVAKVNARWRRLDRYRGRQVGRIQDAKEELKRALRPGRGQSQTRDYSEHDSIAIAENVKSLGLASSPNAQSASWIHFKAQVDLI